MKLINKNYNITTFGQVKINTILKKFKKYHFKYQLNYNVI